MLREAWIVGLKPWEFERLTPAEWDSIREGEKLKQKQLDYRTALICMVIANTHRDPSSKPYSVEDFMPHEPHEQTPEDQLAMMEALNAVLGGRDERPKEGGD